VIFDPSRIRDTGLKIAPIRCGSECEDILCVCPADGLTKMMIIVYEPC